MRAKISEKDQKEDEEFHSQTKEEKEKRISHISEAAGTQIYNKILICYVLCI